MVRTRAPLSLLSLLSLAIAGGCVRAGFDRPDPPGTWVTVAGATFTQGSPPGTRCRHDNQDLHQVTLTRAFAIQTTEVTQGQFRLLMGETPSYFAACGSDCPVEMVTWDDAAAYCNALSSRESLEACYRCQEVDARRSCTQATPGSIYACGGYRLPTDAEWELAYRAGTETIFYSGDVDASLACSSCASLEASADAIGWYCANSGRKTHPVAQKRANARGLYDMAGNVWEWCHDRYQDHLGAAALTDPVGPASSHFRLLRGGAWINTFNALYASQRYSVAESYFNNGVGFRCVRTIDTTDATDMKGATDMTTTTDATD
jgi:formylglycine-generating enzyme required for sulfatase activity